MARLVYVDRDSPFPFPQVYEVEGFRPAIRLGQMQRSLGVVHGVLESFDDDSRRGELKIDGHGFDCYDARPSRSRRRPATLSEYVGVEVRFSFWPSFSLPPRRLGEEPPAGKLPAINISHVRYGDVVVESGHVEVIGKLSRVWEGGFAVTLWSKARQEWLSTVIVGDYPEANHVGRHVWVTGKLDPAEGRIHLEEATLLEFATPEDARAIITAEREAREKREAEEAAAREAEEAAAREAEAAGDSQEAQPAQQDTADQGGDTAQQAAAEQGGVAAAAAQEAQPAQEGQPVQEGEPAPEAQPAPEEQPVQEGQPAPEAQEEQPVQEEHPVQEEQPVQGEEAEEVPPG